MEVVPVIDMAAYSADPDSEESRKVIQGIFEAASTWGFFVLKGTSISTDQQLALMRSAQELFALPLKDKMALDLAQGSVAWRGYMPLGGEQTHGHQDWKEGLYIGPEHPEDHPLSGMPLHGRNRFPDEALPNMRPDIMAYLEQATELGKTLTDILSEGLGLGRKDLRRRWLDPEPVVLFHCFKYAPVSATANLPSTHLKLSADVNKEESFGIGEHTDFGYLTLLKVDSAGLQVLSPTGKWVDVPVIEGALVVNGEFHYSEGIPRIVTSVHLLILDGTIPTQLVTCSIN
ncbi:hypothetical protein Daus18300_009683 [Diaporthe australafricana]|uniref:Fe2OG dioxygenase domain-containing protein n=1 Tax=Diaporthe australafricana TaxID=127596 RepID=A0ABR3WDP3_9PEZI